LRLKELWKNEYFQTVFMLAVFVTGICVFWIGITWGLRTGYPLLAVASGSMRPTLEVGDLIVVQGIPASEVHTAVKTDTQPGDIIVFHIPQVHSDATDELIVHRAVDNITLNGLVYFRTCGDAAGSPDYWPSDYRGENYTWRGMISEKLLVGKVVGRMPWIGNIHLFMRGSFGMYIIVLLLVLIVIIEFVWPYLSKGKKKKEEQKREIYKG